MRHAGVAVTIVPGSTSRMPDHTACPGDFTKLNSSRNPSASTSRRAMGLARIAFGSEPNSTPSPVG
jgi:hypothetical protein